MLHIPKAAGTSLKKALIDKIGADNIYFDYRRPMAKGDLVRKVDCLVSSITSMPRSESLIFGHFLAGKYAQFNGLYFRKRQRTAYITFLRHPLQRALSHFFFWKRTAVTGHRIWEKFHRDNWSLEQFLLSKEHTNLQAKFLWRFPLTQFDFIGLTEHFDDSVKILGHLFPVLKDLSIETENSNPENTVGLHYTIDSDLESEFVRRNQLDYALYHQAVALFLTKKIQIFENGLS